MHFDGTDQDARPRPLTAALIAFVETRPADAGQFYLGHWLAALSDEELRGLADTLECVVQDDGSQGSDAKVEDVVELTLQALRAESPWMVSVPDEDLLEMTQGLLVSATLESLRRKGLVQLDSSLSIRPDSSTNVSLTDRGRSTESIVPTGPLH